MRLGLVLLLLWNMAITLAVLVMVPETMELQTLVELQTQRLSFNEAQHYTDQAQIKNLERRAVLLSTDAALQSEQLDLTLDLLVSARHGGILSSEVRLVAQQLNAVRTARRTLTW